MATNQAKSSVTLNRFDKTLIEDFVLLENGDYILQESGFRIILEQSTLDPVPGTNQAKSSVTLNKVLKS